MEIAILVDQGVDLLEAVHYGRVMLAAELAAYLGIPVFRQPFAIARELFFDFSSSTVSL